jgi:hypothetical protein
VIGSVLIIALVCWVAIVVVVLGLCWAAARGDRSPAVAARRPRLRLRRRREARPELRNTSPTSGRTTRR